MRYACRQKVSWFLSAILVLANLTFLGAIVLCPHEIGSFISPGITWGILGFFFMIIFAVLLTFLYVSWLNKRQPNDN